MVAYLMQERALWGALEGSVQALQLMSVKMDGLNQLYLYVG